jgi:hypothetical protein
MKRGQFLASKEKELEMKNVLFVALTATILAAPPVAAKDEVPSVPAQLEIRKDGDFEEMTRRICVSFANVPSKEEPWLATYRRCKDLHKE